MVVNIYKQKFGLLKNDNPHIYNLLKTRFDRMRLIADGKVKPTVTEEKHIDAIGYYFGIPRNRLNRNFDNLCINELMTWSRTPEGHDFWKNMHYNGHNKSIEEINSELDETFLKSSTLHSKTYNLWL